MKKYLGVKIIQAEPMSEFDFRRSKGMTPANNEVDQPGFKVVYEDGYTSWSPKEVFEKAYRAIDGLTFGLAIEALKQGKKVARYGWNGKGMFVYMVDSASYPAMMPAAKSFFGEDGLVPYNAYFAIKNVNNTVSTWVPSINDCLAEDWQIVE